jgi:ATP-dependent protease ClpP protease subunit
MEIQGEWFLSIFDDIGLHDDGSELIRLLSNVNHVRVIIQSSGGSSRVALALYAALRGKAVQVDVLKAYSAAVVIAMAGERVRIEANARMMLHSPVAFAYGTENDLLTEVGNLRQAKSEIARVLQQRTEQLIETVSQWLETETYFDAEQAVAVGLADEVFTLPPTVAEACDIPAIESGPLDDSGRVLDVLRRLGQVRVKDRAAFARNLAVWTTTAIREV